MTACQGLLAYYHWQSVSLESSQPAVSREHDVWEEWILLWPVDPKQGATGNGRAGSGYPHWSPSLRLMKVDASVDSLQQQLQWLCGDYAVVQLLPLTLITIR